MTPIINDNFDIINSNSIKEGVNDKRYYISLARTLLLQLEIIEPSAKMRHIKELECNNWVLENLSFVSEIIDVANGKNSSQNEDVLFSVTLKYLSACYVIKLCNRLNTETIQKYKICQLDFNNCK
jgi:hypothetical protein